YKRGSCIELKCDINKEKEAYIRFETNEFEKVGPISSVEYGPIVVNYTTLYLLKNATTMHELYLKNRKEIEVYKVLKKISESKGIKLRKEKEGFYIGKDFIKILDNGDIKFNEEIKDINQINHILNY
ncbi:hypothetical protein, partial [Romboutsia sp.]|uniref:hypothetical protein n=1 Tax=Romboutsia sp. TaxID=1965302 RepID=UPI002B67076D